LYWGLFIVSGDEDLPDMKAKHLEKEDELE